MPGKEERVEIDDEQGVFMISVAAGLAGMHPQTLRIYEARGLITPKRSPKKTRLYSRSDVELLQRIQKMTTEQGLNLAGVEVVLEMERGFEQVQRELEQMRQRATQLERQLLAEMERLRQEVSSEIVPYGAYDNPAPQTGSDDSTEEGGRNAA